MVYNAVYEDVSSVAPIEMERGVQKHLLGLERHGEDSSHLRR